MLSFNGVADLSSREWFQQLPAIVLVSVAAGMLGALFNFAHKHILRVCWPCCVCFKHNTSRFNFAMDTLNGYLGHPSCSLIDCP